MIYYCHYNARLHEFVKEFKDWEFSSYHTILKNNNSFLKSQKYWIGLEELMRMKKHMRAGMEKMI